ncbi:MAG: DUF2334 domain-containing protein [Verrucomicrobiota bacterium]|nr:DUF2334 domain-containing protein [Verrucomicrobiota bacterium]
MRYVIIRDDDTNTLTPVECLETLYRPFLDSGLPVCLATIPHVRSNVFLPNGQPEGFLVANKGVKPGTYPIADNQKLTGYLRANRGYEIVQHGYHHEFVGTRTEFDHDNRRDIQRRLDHGTRLLQEAGFEKPITFVAPYDRITRVAYKELATRFALISTGWFELGRLPLEWWPACAISKIRKKPHWQAGGVTFLSHPGCHLSYHRPCETMLGEIQRSVKSRRVTVLVTHWWEFFRENTPDLKFIEVLHETANWLRTEKEIKVVRFSDVANGRVPLD